MIEGFAMSERILVVDDQVELRTHLAGLLRERGKEVRAVPSAEEAFALLDAGEPFDLVILDLDLGPGRMDGATALPLLRRDKPELPVIILTGNATIDGAVDAIKTGAADYLEKDVHLSDRVTISIDKIERMLAALRDNRRLRHENRYLRAERERLSARLAALPGVRRVYASQGNFLLARFDDAQLAFERLLAAGVVVRDQRGAPQLGDALRISIGTRQENDAVIAALTDMEVAA